MIKPLPFKFLVLILCIAATSCDNRGQQEQPPRFNHVMLYVSDIDASIEFYQNAFGIRLDNKIDKLMVEQSEGVYDTVTVNMAFMRLKGSRFVLELSQQDLSQDSSAIPLHFQHIGIEVEDIESAMEQALETGAEMVRPVTTVMAEGVKAKNAFLRGPDGESVELMEIMEGTF